MATVPEKKAACGYTPKLIPSACGNCKNFKSDRVLSDWMEASNERRRIPYYAAEKDGFERNLHCTLHGFAVEKMGACNDWAPKPDGGAA